MFAACNYNDSNGFTIKSIYLMFVKPNNLSVI